MSLNPESKYPSRRAYLVEGAQRRTTRRACRPGGNLVTGQSREFASGGELLEPIAEDLEANAEGKP
jgi:hypothetical protein